VQSPTQLPHHFFSAAFEMRVLQLQRDAAGVPGIPKLVQEGRR